MALNKRAGVTGMKVSISREGFAFKEIQEESNEQM
jgi:hypothetical protein